ncbi:MAG: type II toxin-antitoxin system HicA family toxin [Acidimicrobiales bacterium]
MRRPFDEIVTPLSYSQPVKVRDVIRTLERDGWRLDRQVGSHRQFRHPDRLGTVTVAGKPSDEVPKGTLGSIWRQAGRSGRQNRD